VLLIEHQPSPFTFAEGRRGSLPDHAHTVLLGLGPIQNFEFPCFLDSQPDENSLADCVNKIPSRSCLTRNNHIEPRA